MRSIIKYRNRKFYDYQTNSYVTLKQIAEIVKQNRISIIDACNNGKDITKECLNKILIELRPFSVEQAISLIRDVHICKNIEAVKDLS